MIRLVQQVRFTIVAVVIAFFLIPPVSGFEWLEQQLTAFTTSYRPAVLAAMLVLLFGIGMDYVRAQRRRRDRASIEAEKLETLRATMRTVQHIVNTFLNDLLLLEIQAAGVLPQDTLDQLDDSVQQIANKLKALGDVDAVVETPLAGGTGVEYPEPPETTRTKHTGAIARPPAS